MKFVYLFVAFSFLVSCAAIKPESPAISVEATPVLIQPSSTLLVPLTINLAPYFKESEKSIPKKFSGNDENCDGVSFAYTFVREPIVFKGSGNAILFDVDGKYGLDINYCAKCSELFSDKPHCITPRVYVSCGTKGEQMRKVEIGYTTSIKLSDDFKLKANTTLRKFETIDPCEISVFKYDATSTLKKEITESLKNLEDVIDKEIGKVNLKKEAEKAWKIISEPIALGKFGYFHANPTKIGFDNLKFNGTTATADLALELSPKLTTSTIEYKPTALPKLSNVTDEKGFNITLDVVATYDSLSKLLTSELKGKEVMIKKKKIIFETIEIFGASNHQVSLKIGFTGSKKGTLFLMGTPNFNQQNQIISFPDIAFDIKTKSALLKSAKWLFSSKITDALKSSSTIDLHPHLKTVQQMMEKQLNATLQPGVVLKGTVKQISMQGIYPNAETLTLRVNTTGALELGM